MTSQDKLLAACLFIALLFCAVLYRLDGMHNESMAKIAAQRQTQEWELKVRLEEAKANQARYRALEVGYLCQFVDKTGEVYFDVECEK